MLAPVASPKTLAGLLAEVEAHHRLVELAEAGAGRAQVAAGDDAAALERDEDGAGDLAVLALDLLREDLDLGGELPVEVLQDLGLRRRGALRRIGDEAELEQRGVLDQLLDALGIVDAGKLQHDAARAEPLSLDHRLGDAEGVDPVADGLLGLAHRLLADVVVLLRLAREDQGLRGGGVGPERADRCRSPSRPRRDARRERRSPRTCCPRGGAP